MDHRTVGHPVLVNSDKGTYLEDIWIYSGFYQAIGRVARANWPACTFKLHMGDSWIMSHNEFYVTPKVRLRQHWSWTEIELHIRALRTALDYWSWCPVSRDSTEFSMTHTLVLYFHRIEGYLELRQEDFLICWEEIEAFSDQNFSFDSFHDSIHEDLPKVSSTENSS